MTNNMKRVRLPEKAVLVKVRRLANPRAAAWTGWTDEGRQLHIGYRPGNLVVLAATPNGSCTTWRTLLECRPELIEAETEVQRWVNGRRWLQQPTDRQTGQQLRQRLRIEAEQGITARIRSWAWCDAAEPGKDKPTGPAKVRWSQVRHWLELREEHWDQLALLGLTGGPLRLKVEAWLDQGEEDAARA